MALAVLNFFLAGARDGLGPFLDAYLSTKGWQSMDLGMLATACGVIGLLAGPSAGASGLRSRPPPPWARSSPNPTPSCG